MTLNASSSSPGAPSSDLGLNDMRIYSNAGENVVSDANEASGTGNLDCLKYGEKAIDYKACKRLFKRFGIKGNAFQALSILWLYLHFMGKDETGATLQAVAGWSGFGLRWEKSMAYYFAQLIELNAVEKIPFNGGYRYLITRKGLFILQVWEDERQDIIKDIQTRHAAAMIKAEQTRDNVRARLAKRDNKGRFYRQQQPDAE